MITWHEEIIFDFSDPVTNHVFDENSIFFDIETTGFSPARTQLYLIGCATRKDDVLCLDQFFAEGTDDEPALLTAFSKLLSDFAIILSFNGIGFDIPYLKAKYAAHQIDDPFGSHDFLDLYKETARFKFLFGLPSLKQKSVELFLGIDRVDAYSGGELIEVYKEYRKSPSRDTLALLRGHNYEDVLYMPKLLSILFYRELWEGAFTLCSIEASEYTSMDGVSGNKELFFALTLSYPVPKPVSVSYDDCYLSMNGSTARLRIRLFEGELRFFYENPNNYYYLPGEDLAIHKDIASGVDKANRIQATAANCYNRKYAIFLPQYEELFTPAFRERTRSKKCYFELSETFIGSADMQRQYVRHILTTLQSNRK